MEDKKKSAFLRCNQVVEITGLSKATLWRLERDGKFPKKRQLSANAVGWIASEIEEWITSREYKEN